VASGDLGMGQYRVQQHIFGGSNIHEATILAGWWYTYPSEKYDFVSWDDNIPNIWKNK